MSGNPLPDQSNLKTFMRWLCAFAIVIALYGVGILAFHTFNKFEPPRAKGGQEAIMLEFAEEATAPLVENESETIQQETIVEDVVPEKIPENIIEEKADVEPETEPAPTSTPTEIPSDMVEEVKPKVEEKPKKELEKTKTPEKKKPVEQPKKQEQQKPNLDAQKAKQKQKASAPQLNTKDGNKFAAPNNNRQQGDGGTADPSWKRKVQIRIDGVAKRVGRQSGGVKGVAFVSFSYDGNGRVVNATIARSSGKKNADDIALRIAKQSSPLPAPPQGKAGNITLRVQF